MDNKSQLFQIQDSLNKNRKQSKVKKEKNEEKAGSVSMGFYDDLKPIRVSGRFGFYQTFSQSENEPFEQSVTEDASFSIIEDEEEYSVNKESEMISFQNSDSVNALTDEEDLLDLSGKSESNIPPVSLSDAEIAADLSAIFSTGNSGDHNYAEVSKENEKDDFFKKILEKNEQSKTASVEESSRNPAPSGNTNHSIFDAIAKSLNYSNAFDLGDYVLEQRFDLFDEEENKRVASESGKEKNILSENKSDAGSAAYDTKIEELSTRSFVEDLDIIHETARSLNAAPDKTGKTWPSAPANLDQPTVEKTKQIFGEFEFENIAGGSNCEVKIKGNWESTNIEEIDIPQLKGKKNGTTKKEITKGVIRFNKKAKKQLQKLWKAWEDANLLDRILTYDGGFVPRYKKLKGGGCGTSLSNHAWGSAFDINAEWNGLGTEPALVGEKGCTRELVEIANQHGFYWGGHFSTKDGMHFEVAKIIEYND